MSNEQRKEKNTLARQASRAHSIHDIMFHHTTAAMVYADLDIINGQEHVALNVGSATFFFDGKTNEKLVEMQLLGLAIVAASEELLRNGPA